jgi:hypothetical protein
MVIACAIGTSARKENAESKREASALNEKA